MQDRGEPPTALRPHDWGLVALAVLPLLALAVVAIVSVGHGYHGADDNAMTELRISDIGRHWPQIGPFSRDGWSHPGPALFFALLVPFRLTGSHSNGLLVGATLINAAAVAGMVLLARRRGGRPLALLVALGALALMTSLGNTFLWHPWNPYVTVLPFGLAVLATWCVVCGDAWCLPLLAAVGTFCVQTHVGYAPLVAGLAVVAGLGVARHVWSAHTADAEAAPVRLRTSILVTAGILVVAWAPPLYQQVTADHGNLGAIWHYFGSSRSEHSLRDGLSVVTAQFSWDPGWLLGRTDINPFTAQPRTLSGPTWPVWWFALGAALAWSWYRRRRAARALGIVLAASILVGVVAVARTIGPIFEYRLRFVWVLGMLTAVYVLWVLTLAIGARVRRPQRWATVGTTFVLASIVGLSAYGVVTAAGADPPNREEGRVIAALVPQLVRNLPPGPGVVVPSVQTFAEGPLLTGVMVDLEHHDIPVRARAGLDNRLRFGDHRLLGNERVRAELRIAVDDQIEKVQQTPCARIVAYWGRASRSERARAVRAVARIERALLAKRITIIESFRRAQRWSADLPAAAIFATGCGGPAP